MQNDLEMSSISPVRKFIAQYSGDREKYHLIELLIPTIK